MPNGNGRLKKLDEKGGRYLKDSDSGLHCYHVDNPQKLIQAAGYLKHVYGAEEGCAVFFRGQTRLYNTLAPSLFRGIRRVGAANGRYSKLKAILDEIDQNKEVLRAVSASSREPLLQHYGVRTRWIDLVDNVWVALWFACHTAQVAGKFGQFLSFERRGARILNRSKEFAYILMVKGAMAPDSKLGFGFHGDDRDLWVDLRRSTPSQFVRPHAQHALLMRRRSIQKDQDIDFMDTVIGVLRITLDDGLRWLGEGALVSTECLFPSPVYDTGYRELLTSFLIADKTLGAISHIGP